MTIFSAIHIIAEHRIEEALREGTLDLPAWRNRPLPEDDQPLMPDDLKMACKLLKNAGFLPPELETRKAISELEELIASTEDQHIRVRQISKLNFLVRKLDILRNRPATLTGDGPYLRRLTEKISCKTPRKQ